MGGGTSCEEAVFGEDGYGVYDEDGCWGVLVGRVDIARARVRYTVYQTAKVEEEESHA